MKKRFYYLLIICSILCNFILYTPNKMHQELYNGPIYAVAIGFIVSCCNAYMLLYILNNYKDCSLAQINKELYNKYVAILFTTIYIILNNLIAFFMFRALLELVIRFLLPNTNIITVSLLILLVVYIDLFNNNRTYLNFIGYVSLIIILLSMLQVSLSLRNIKFYNLMGTVIHSNKVPSLPSIGAASFYFSGVSHLAALNTEFPKLSAKKTCLIFLVIGIPAALLSIYIPVGIWGPVAVQNVQFTWSATADTLQINLFFIERGIFILFPLFFLMASSQILNYWHTALALFKETMPIKWFQTGFILSSSIIYITVTLLFKNSQSILSYGSLVMTIAFLANTFLTALSFFKVRLKKGIRNA